MKQKKILFSIFTLYILSCFSQNHNRFTWMKGSMSADMSGTYGVQGTAASINNPGARSAAVTWKDTAGNFWLFGGVGKDAQQPGIGWLNDLWKYDPATNQWTWVKGPSAYNQPGNYGIQGTPSPSNNPGARANSVTWTDATGKFWLFGGEGIGSAIIGGYLNDLWRYDPGTNQWTWMKGSVSSYSLYSLSPGNYGSLGISSPSNNPGARMGSVSWTDNNGNLWLHGGLSWQNGPVNFDDLWKYTIATNEWTWMKGSSLINQSGVYGTKGIAASINKPGGRQGSSVWMQSGSVWLFGGTGWDAGGNPGFLNDLWKYDFATNNWTWVSGSNLVDQPTVYGTQGISSSSNIPGARYGCKSWVNSSGNFFLFGGLGPNLDWSNDLWRYNNVTNEWTWTKGGPGSTISYGSQGVSSASNYPGPKLDVVGWADANNNLWLFGGHGMDATSVLGPINDLWKFSSCTEQPLLATSSNTMLCPGHSATLTAQGASSYSWSTGQTGSSISVSPAATTSYSVFSTDPGSCGDLTSITQWLSPVISLSVSSSKSLTCVGESFNLHAAGANTFTWSTGQQGATIAMIASASGVYMVTGTTPLNCIVSASISQSVSSCNSLMDAKLNKQDDFFVYPNPGREFSVSMNAASENTKFIITNTLGQVVFEQELLLDHSLLQPGLAEGIYYYKVIQHDKVMSTGKLLVK